MARILVVDDEEGTCAVLKMALGRRGWPQVDVAYTGEQALELMRQQYYDVMILDLVMPGIGGVGVLRERDKFPCTAVIVLTAHGSKETAVIALRNEAVDYLDKPLLPDAIVDVVEKHVLQYTTREFLVDMLVRMAYYNNKPLDLTPETFDLLVPFIRFPDKVFSYQELAFMIVGKTMEQEQAMQYLKAQMSRLRARLESQTGREVIRRGQHGPGRHVEFSYYHEKPRCSGDSGS